MCNAKEKRPENEGVWKRSTCSSWLVPFIQMEICSAGLTRSAQMPQPGASSLLWLQEDACVLCPHLYGTGCKHDESIHLSLCLSRWTVHISDVLR